MHSVSMHYVSDSRPRVYSFKAKNANQDLLWAE